MMTLTTTRMLLAMVAVKVVMMSALDSKTLFNVEEAAVADMCLMDLQGIHYQKAADVGLFIFHATLDTSDGPVA